MNVWCVGRNYAEHAKELGNDVPAEPLIFLKAGSCVTTGSTIALPAWSEDVHHELEIALQFDSKLNFSAAALALDLTERAAQNRLKAKGQPWTLAKSFRGACPLTASVSVGDVSSLRLWLKVNGELRQDGRATQMIFSPAVLREFVLERFPVEAGDWLLTGTPSGVGPLKRGDRLEAALEDDGARALITAQWTVV